MKIFTLIFAKNTNMQQAVKGEKSPGNRLTDIIQGASSMDVGELEQLLEGVSKLLKSKKPVAASDIEKELIKKIHTVLPQSIRRREKQLYEKMREEAILAHEKEELQLLIEMMEQKSAERIHLLGQLAQLRKITLSELIASPEFKKQYAKA